MAMVWVAPGALTCSGPSFGSTPLRLPLVAPMPQVLSLSRLCEVTPAGSAVPRQLLGALPDTIRLLTTVVPPVPISKLPPVTEADGPSVIVFLAKVSLVNVWLSLPPTSWTDIVTGRQRLLGQADEPSMIR